MTAYAATEKTDGRGVTISVEIRTYNSKFLDIALRLPSGFAGLEEKIKGLIGARLVRGRVDMRLVFSDQSESALAYSFDQDRLKAYLLCVEQLKAFAGIEGQLSIDFLAGLPGIITPAEAGQAIERHWPLMTACIQEALELVDRMRRQEGDFIGRDLSGRLNDIEQRLAAIEMASADLPAIYRDKLQARMTSLTNGIVALDPLRIVQEAAFMADRSDISEEIIRVRSHIGQFRTIFADGEPAGRRLNFLLQELSREFNTMGSKAGQAQVAHIIVDVKAEIEKIREQVQNVE